MRPRRIRRGELFGQKEVPVAGGGFNAATANSPWRTSPARAGRRASRRFNAATANSPWRTFTDTENNTLTLWLQCGHGEFAVENMHKTGLDYHDAVASMRPRRIRRGEQGLGTRHRQGLRRLQCGHGEFAVEN